MYRNRQYIICDTQLFTPSRNTGKTEEIRWLPIEIIKRAHLLIQYILWDYASSLKVFPFSWIHLIPASKSGITLQLEILNKNTFSIWKGCFQVKTYLCWCIFYFDAFWMFPNQRSQKSRHIKQRLKPSSQFARAPPSAPGISSQHSQTSPAIFTQVEHWEIGHVKLWFGVIPHIRKPL